MTLAKALNIQHNPVCESNILLYTVSIHFRDFLSAIDRSKVFTGGAEMNF